MTNLKWMTLKFFYKNAGKDQTKSTNEFRTNSKNRTDSITCILIFWAKFKLFLELSTDWQIWWVANFICFFLQIDRKKVSFMYHIFRIERQFFFRKQFLGKLFCLKRFLEKSALRVFSLQIWSSFSGQVWTVYFWNWTDLVQIWRDLEKNKVVVGPDLVRSRADLGNAWAGSSWN